MIFYPRFYRCPDYVVPMTAIDEQTKDSVIACVAVVTNHIAEIVSLMKMPHVSVKDSGWYWSEKVEDYLRGLSVRKVWGEVPAHKAEHYKTYYGFRVRPEPAQTNVGELAVVEKEL